MSIRIYLSVGQLFFVSMKLVCGCCCLITLASAVVAAPRNGKIAFTSERDGNREIYVMEPDGTNQVRITNNSVVDDHPMWSPDGTKLAFVSQRQAGGFAIFQMNIDATNKVELTPLSSYVNRAPDGIVGFSMSWSPDGKTIAYQDGAGGSFPGYQDIFVVDLETKVSRNLTGDGSGSGFCDLCDYHPSFSPDGSTILYASPRFNGACTSLYAMDPDGTNRRLLNGDHCPAYSPSWSPDGTKILFVQLNGEFIESELRVADSDGSNVAIFDGGYPDLRNRDYPRWSPDAAKIAFNMVDPATGDIEIFVKNVDGTAVTQLTNSPSSKNYRPSWQRIASRTAPFDYDGDGKTDFSVWRYVPNIDFMGFWHIAGSEKGEVQVTEMDNYGRIVPADYDGDGRTDLAVAGFDKAEPVAWLIWSLTAQRSTFQYWGLRNDLGVPSDFDGDGRADFAAWRPAEGKWYIASTGDGTIRVQQWGMPGDTPTPADFDGDGKTDLAVFRPTEGKWYVFGSLGGTITAISWGLDGDRPVPGDYNGDGRADFAVYRRSDNTWYRLHSSDFSMHITQWGLPNDIVTPGDYDGDGKLDLATWRPSEARWYVLTASQQILTQYFGLNGDVPTPSAFVY